MDEIVLFERKRQRWSFAEMWTKDLWPDDDILPWKGGWGGCLGQQNVWVWHERHERFSSPESGPISELIIRSHRWVWPPSCWDRFPSVQRQVGPITIIYPDPLWYDDWQRNAAELRWPLLMWSRLLRLLGVISLKEDHSYTALTTLEIRQRETIKQDDN